MFRNDKIKAPVLIPFTLLLLLGLGTVMAISFEHEREERNNELAKDLLAVKSLFALQIDNDASKLHAALCPISRDRTLKELFINGDEKGLLQHTTGLFNSLRKMHKVTHFYLLDTSRRVVLRVHNPDQKGDIIRRTTAKQAEQTQSESQGIELGPNGNVTVRAVKPWFLDGKLIGYLELGEEINQVTELIHKVLGVDLTIILHQAYIQKSAMTSISDQQNPFIYSSTLKQPLPEIISNHLKNDNHLKSGGVDSLNGKHPLYAAEFSLTDAANRHIGDIVVLRDVSSLQKAFKQSLLFTSAFILICGFLVFILLYLILNRVEKVFRHQREVETSFIRLNSQHKRIVQIEKLSEVGRTISEIAHQINNPLVGVVNMAQLALRETDDQQRVRELLQEILQAGKDSHNYIQRMLEFTRVSRSQIEPTEIIDVINSTISLFQQSTVDHPEVITDLPPEPLVLNIDAVLIRHALFNLLSNAAEAGTSSNIIKVTLQPGEDDEHNPGWFLKISDKGTGLTKKSLDNLFIPFFTSKANGTGLGLSVVMHVAILHGGIATGENLPQGGAVFAIWLPNKPTSKGQI